MLEVNEDIMAAVRRAVESGEVGTDFHILGYGAGMKIAVAKLGAADKLIALDRLEVGGETYLIGVLRQR